MAAPVAAGWWLKHPKSGHAVLVVHEETRDRCLSEGWTHTTDPRLAPPEPPLVTDAALSVPVPVPDPVPPSADLADLTAIGDSPEALAVALEAAEAAAQTSAVRERNTAARTTFGVQTPPPQHAAPAPPVRKPAARQPGR